MVLVAQPSVTEALVKSWLAPRWNRTFGSVKFDADASSEIKFAHIREANISPRSDFTLRSRISLARKGKFSWKSPNALHSDFFWWGRTDSNHRSETQQIYSLSPLATRELPQILNCSSDGAGRILTPFGAGRRTRTPDLLITNQLLYQLSYTGVSNRTRVL